jgi:hypothetical protein
MWEVGLWNGGHLVLHPSSHPLSFGPSAPSYSCHPTCLPLSTSLPMMVHWGSLNACCLGLPVSVHVGLSWSPVQLLEGCADVALSYMFFDHFKTDISGRRLVYLVQLAVQLAHLPNCIKLAMQLGCIFQKFSLECQWHWFHCSLGIHIVWWPHSQPCN